MPISKLASKECRFIPIPAEGADSGLSVGSLPISGANRSASMTPGALGGLDSSFSRIPNTPASTFVRELMILGPVMPGKDNALGQVMFEINKALQACDDPISESDPTVHQNLFTDARACAVLVCRAQKAIEIACHQATNVPLQPVVIPDVLTPELFQTMRTYVTAAALGRLGHLCARHDLHDETFSSYVTSLDRQVLQSAVNMAYLAGENLQPLRLMFQLASMDAEGSPDLVLQVLRLLRENPYATDEMADLQHLALFAGVLAVLHDHVSRGEGIAWLVGEGLYKADFGTFVMNLIKEGALENLFVPDQPNNLWWKAARTLIGSVCKMLGLAYDHDVYTLGSQLEDVAQKVAESIARRAGK